MIDLILKIDQIDRSFQSIQYVHPYNTDTITNKMS